MEGIKTPFGTVSKRTALIGGGILVAGAALVWYRRKQTSASIPQGEVNPATGYVYGSQEDAAALAAQADYVSASGGGGGSSSGGVSIPGQGFVTNAQWAQEAISYMTTAGLVTDPGPLAEALGKYLAGSPVTDAQKNLIEQAIAIEGQAPVAGTNGYPPHINQSPVQTTTNKPAAVTGLKATSAMYEVDLAWSPVTGAERYEVRRLGTSGGAKGQGGELVTTYGPSAKLYPLASKSGYTFWVKAINSAGAGPETAVSTTTK